MILPQWSLHLSLGLKQVDDNHQLLFKLLHIIRAEATCPSEGMVALLTALQTLSMCHFRCEEDWMARLSFSGLARHKQEHDAFIVQVTSFRTGCMKGEGSDNGFLFFLQDWMVQHFGRTNEELRLFLMQNGYITKQPGAVALDL